ncbi:hypothetical protein IWW40_003725 [Coemansia sp. RSA 1250]|nr:hypothetical protein IWW40_003725 [Coemansia sp. RSA 1250]
MLALVCRSLKRGLQRSTRRFSTTTGARHVSDQFVRQMETPGPTSSTLSSGVVPYFNDPMIPRGKYFKPRGIERSDPLLMLMLGRHPCVFKHHKEKFTLSACPWNVDEYPRDYNGLRIRDYRVAILASKKHYKSAHKRWRITRLVRTAAMLILPDKGLKRCDYLFHLHEGLLEMDRDELFLEVEDALVDVERRIYRRWNRDGRQKRPVSAIGTDATYSSTEAESGGNDKILNAPSRRGKNIYSISEIIEDLQDA